METKVLDILPGDKGQCPAHSPACGQPAKSDSKDQHIFQKSKGILANLAGCDDERCHPCMQAGGRPGFIRRR